MLFSWKRKDKINHSTLSQSSKNNHNLREKTLLKDFPPSLPTVVDEHEASGLSNGSTGQLSVGGLVGVREVDSKTLEKLSERSYHKDYMRLGLGSLASNSTTVPPRTKSDFRITTCNVNYQLCRRWVWWKNFCEMNLKVILKLIVREIINIFSSYKESSFLTAIQPCCLCPLTRVMTAFTA